MHFADKMEQIELLAEESAPRATRYSRLDVRNQTVYARNQAFDRRLFTVMDLISGGPACTPVRVTDQWSTGSV